MYYQIAFKNNTWLYDYFILKGIYDYFILKGRFLHVSTLDSDWKLSAENYQILKRNIVTFDNYYLRCLDYVPMM